MFPIFRRERERLLHPLERLAHPIASVNSNVVSTKRNGNGNYQADPNKIVKSFSRSAAGHKMPSPSDLRPFPVLDMTVSYLIQEYVFILKFSSLDNSYTLQHRFKILSMVFTLSELPAIIFTQKDGPTSTILSLIDFVLSGKIWSSRICLQLTV